MKFAKLRNIQDNRSLKMTFNPFDELHTPRLISKTPYTSKFGFASAHVVAEAYWDLKG